MEKHKFFLKALIEIHIYAYIRKEVLLPNVEKYEVFLKTIIEIHIHVYIKKEVE